MKSRILTVEEFTSSVLEVAAPLPVKPENGEPESARGFERALETARVRRSALERAWESGSGHVGDRSAWEAFNGAVEVLDHDEQSFRTNGSRLTALLDGTLGRRKEAVREAVLALVRS